ncbi:MAG: hypothetical protein WC788_08235 [Candidatus Paceibacterota bacterium]|jgi:hypothetical protein
MIKKYNISKPMKYIKNDEEKTYWANVGTMTEFVKEDGSVSRIIEIPAIGLKASVFEQKKRDDEADEYGAQAPRAAIRPAQTARQSESDEIRIEDIPF